MKRTLWRTLIVLALVSNLMMVIPASANPPAPDDQPGGGATDQIAPVVAKPAKPIDQPEPGAVQRIRERLQLLEAGQTDLAASLALSGTDRVLVILVDFAGTDVFTWTAPITPTDPTTGSRWDPLGIANTNEDTGVLGDCSKIITQTKAFTYSGPTHNTIERPRAPTDRSGDSIWTSDFSKQWFNDFMFGNGVVISYTMQDSTKVNESFVGQSVKDYFSDISTGAYTITGDVIGWLGLQHSTWYYDADQCPGARSTSTSGVGRGAIPGAGNARTLVKDALNAVNAISNTITTLTGPFNWADYDKNGDGIIDRLWIVHAGYGEEDSPTLLNRVPVSGTTPLTNTFYGESAVWSHSSAVTPPYSVTQNIAAGAYIVMPENGGIGVFAHEYAHNLGAMDLYAYNEGETSTGFWALQADDWTGYPIGFEPPAPDPMHLDWWGWLNPMVITDAAKTYEFTLGQASRFSTIPGNAGMYRGAKVELPDGAAPLAVPPWQGSHYWWGGKQDEANASMTTKTSISMTGGTTATLSFDLVYDIEPEWDFLWTQVSTDNGATWKTLSNTHTICTHDSGWIGGLYGMDGQCGLSGHNANWPAPEAQTFDLTPYIGKNMLLKFWYMTDWATTYTGAFVDNVKVTVGGATKFSDNAEGGSGNWNYVAPWQISDGTQSFKHNFYLQWRNVGATGGYDSALGDPRWRYGPANTGLLVWYNNYFYSDNEVFSYLTDYPGWGPKGRMLVVDSHPDPYREPAMVAAGYNNEGGNVVHRSLMRDAPFSLLPTVGFTMTNSYPFTTTTFTTRFSGQAAVSEFHDALGYYPGAEYISRGPGYVPASMKWATKQWDASTVVPSKAFYGIKAPGYVGTGASQQEFRFACASTNTGRLGCYWYGANTGLGYNGGTGDPREVNGQYGWNVKILSQTDMTATVRVWNLAVGKNVGPSPAPITAPGTHWFTYTVALNNMGSVAAPVNVTITLPAGLNFVSGGPSGSTMLPPGGTASVDRQFAWLGYSLAGNTTVTFTILATTTVAAGDPLKTWVAYADVDDGVNPPTRDTWSTTASLFTAPGERPAAGYLSSKSGKPGETVLHRVTFTNTSLYNTDSFTVTATTSPLSWPDYLLPAGAGMLEASAVPIVIPSVAPGATAEVFVLVTIPSTVAPGAKATTTVTTISVGDPTKTGSMTLTTMTPYLIYMPLVLR